MHHCKRHQATNFQCQTDVYILKINFNIIKLKLNQIKSNQINTTLQKYNLITLNTITHIYIKIIEYIKTMRATNSVHSIQKYFNCYLHIVHYAQHY